MNWRFLPAAAWVSLFISGCMSDRERITGTPDRPKTAMEDPNSVPKKNPVPVVSDPGPQTVDEKKFRAHPTGLRYATLKPGTGKKAVPNDVVMIHYTGWLFDGHKRFDTSRDSGEPYLVQLGAGNVIPGWELSIVGMQKGEVRQLVIPPDLAYGAAGYPPDIPPNATLIFEVELARFGP